MEEITCMANCKIAAPAAAVCKWQDNSSAATPVLEGLCLGFAHMAGIAVNLLRHWLGEQKGN